MRVSFEEFDQCTFRDISALQDEALKAEDRIEQRFRRLGILTWQVHLKEEVQTKSSDLFPRLWTPEPEPPPDPDAEDRTTAFWLDTTRAAIKTRARMGAQ